MIELHALSNYTFEQEIGQGSFATVYLGRRRATNELVAIKAVPTAKLNKKLAENLACEIDILKGIKHPNIIDLYEIERTSKFIYLVMEYCGGGDLAYYLKKRTILPEKTIKQLLIQLRNAMKELWSKNLIHRDLKPQNLLLTAHSEKEDDLVLKVADFGFARYVEPAGLAETLCGSPLYMAPEILKYEKYDAKSDMWSIGVLAYEMAYGITPFQATNHIQLLRVIESFDDSTFIFPSHIKTRTLTKKALGSGQLARAGNKYTATPVQTSLALRDLISRLLKKDPKDRIEFSAFYRHSFFDERSPDTLQSNTPSTSIEQSGSVNAASLSSSIDQAVSNALGLIGDAAQASLELSDLLIRIDSFDSKLLSILKTTLAVVLILDHILGLEMQRLNVASSHSMSSVSSSSSCFLSTPGASLSSSRVLSQEQRRNQIKSALVLLHYSINLLEHCQQLVKTAHAMPESDKAGLIALGKWISFKTEDQCDFLDELKYHNKASALIKSSSSAAMSSSLPSRQAHFLTAMAEEAVTTNVCEIIYEHACKVAKDAGIQELLGNQKQAETAYNTAIFMLETIINPTKYVPLTSYLAQVPALDDNASAILKQIQAKMEARIQYCK